ncbi:dolichyl-diphosphooligosaccharide-protein glycosyltransferase subunit 1-like protein [Sarcoptes scabiei]|uniref:Dolichyl-diphosphooligosaccharide--protein glycosyltransferase subunit 1 n=1 Tax=Sarcoptes scabiei TaxID=52283 RepID=A0A132A1A9_SARSC|nr:dolichyl-diphosphooligosaccharide-protein glycosyltransferase subunit 1-like protein [Sarcoptes scabiei]
MSSSFINTFVVILLTYSNLDAVLAKISNENVLNSKVDRIIDISNQLVKIKTQINVLNKNPEPLTEYLIEFGDSRHDRSLSYLQTSRIDASTKKKIPLKHTRSLTRSDSDAGNIYKIDLSDSPVQDSAGTIQLEIEAVFTHLLDPFPTEIVQADRQLVVYLDKVYFPTPYLTEIQTTEVRLPLNSGLESYTKIRPVVHNDRIIKYGPYEKISASQQSEQMRMHFENNSPFLTVQNLERSIQISHWAGAISIEETLDVFHSGAKLKGPFSRYEYQREPTNNGISSIRSWKTRLPAGAFDIYYRDDIGNISTSNVRSSSSAVYVDIKPRFPLFGGWKTRYILGYTLPSKNNLFAMDSNILTDAWYTLKIPFIDHIFDNMVIDQATIKVILPEGSSNFKIRKPYEIEEKPNELFYSYLDTVGRPVLVLTKNNLVEWHMQTIEIKYQFKPFYLLQEPLLIVGSIFGLCLLVMALIRTKISLNGK